jgi:hypothetical protein
MFEHADSNGLTFDRAVVRATTRSPELAGLAGIARLLLVFACLFGGALMLTNLAGPLSGRAGEAPTYGP